MEMWGLWRSNEEIIKECEEAANAGRDGKAEEVVVPSELKTRWKDEMGKDKEGMELAEGLMQLMCLIH